MAAEAAAFPARLVEVLKHFVKPVSILQ